MPLTESEVKLHGRAIGASMLGAVLGVNPFSGPIDAWLRLTGRAKEQDTPESIARKAWGHVQEELLAAWYARECGVEIGISPTLVHPELPWAIATPDRIVRGGEVLVECKHVGDRVAWHWLDGPPDYVRLQCVWQMFVCRAIGMPVARVDVVVSLAGAPPVIHQVPYDAEIEALAFEGAREFWQTHVLTDVAPAVDGSSTYQEWLRRKFPSSNGLMVDAPEAEQWARQYEEAKIAAAAATADKELAANHLRAAIGENDGVRGSWGRVTNRTSAAGTRTLRVSLAGNPRARKVGRATAQEIDL